MAAGRGVAAGRGDGAKAGAEAGREAGRRAAAEAGPQAAAEAGREAAEAGAEAGRRQRSGGGRRASAEVGWLCEAARERLRSGGAADALRLADAALRVRPGHRCALLARGEALLRLRRGAQALEALSSVWENRPSPRSGLLLVRAAEAALPPDEALALCRRACQRFPRDRRLQVRLALCCERAGRADEALAVYGRLGHGRPARPGAAPRPAEAAAAAGRTAAAAMAADRRAPGSGRHGSAFPPAGSGEDGSVGDGVDGFAYTRYVRLALRGMDEAEALDEVGRLLAHPGRGAIPDLHLLCAEILERLGRMDEAVGACDRARRLAAERRPGEGFFLAQAAYCRRRAGRTAEAFVLLRQVLDRDPGDPAAVAAFVSDARDLHREREARRFLRDLALRHPDRPGLWSWVRRLGPAGGGVR